MLFNFLEKFANNYNNPSTYLENPRSICYTLHYLEIQVLKLLEKYKLVMLENYITIFNVPI